MWWFNGHPVLNRPSTARPEANPLCSALVAHPHLISSWTQEWTMKWCAAVALVLALVVKFAWHSSIEFGFPINPTTDIGYPISTFVFWFLLALAVLFLLVDLLKSWNRRRR
jgi:hypothetical protein